MDIKGKIKSAWKRLTGGRAKKNADSELGADEVIKKEVFPKTTAKAAKYGKNGCTKKPASKRTRPTNSNYQMIDPDGDTFDAGQS